MRIRLVFFGLLCFALWVNSQTSALSGEQLLRQQQQQFERSIQQEQIEKQRQLDKSYDFKEQKEDAPILDTLHTKSDCFTLDSIIFKDAYRLSVRRQRKLTAPFIGRCITPKLLQTLMEHMNNDYIKRGYFTTRAYLETQNIKSGTLELVVIPGKLDRIVLDSLNGNRLFTKTQLWTSFGSIKDKVLNLRAIEQGIDQLDRLSAYRASMKVAAEPDKPSYSSLSITRHKQTRPTRLRISTNNAGQQQTGLYNGKFIVEQDSFLKLNETFYGAFTHDLSFDIGNKYSRNLYLSLEVPLHYWTISGSYTRSSYLNTVVATNTTFQTSGNSSFSTYKIQRKLFRNQNNKLTISADLNLKSTESFVEDVKNEVGSRKLSIVNFSLNHTVNARWGYLSTNLSFITGLKYFDAHKDVGPFNEFTPRAQYQKLSLNTSYYKNFNVKHQSFTFQSTLSGQYSDDPLFASEQISIGGAYSVRGFRNKSILGDDGFYLSNTLSYRLPSLTKSILLNKLLTKIQLFIGYDQGYVRQKGGREASFGEGEGSLSGMATGLRFNSKRLQFDLTYARALKTESFIPSEETLFFNTMLRLF